MRHLIDTNSRRFEALPLARLIAIEFLAFRSTEFHSKMSVSRQMEFFLYSQEGSRMDVRHSPSSYSLPYACLLIKRNECVQMLREAFLAGDP